MFRVNYKCVISLETSETKRSAQTHKATWTEACEDRGAAAFRLGSVHVEAPAVISHARDISSSLFVRLLADRRSAWRVPQRQQPPTPQHAPSLRWCSPTSRTHTHLQPPSPAATPSLPLSSPTVGTGWASLR